MVTDELRATEPTTLVALLHVVMSVALTRLELAKTNYDEIEP